jgi:hypothetical protein
VPSRCGGSKQVLSVQFVGDAREGLVEILTGANSV